MKVYIVGADGAVKYFGDESDSKAQRLLADGCTAVPASNPRPSEAHIWSVQFGWVLSDGRARDLALAALRRHRNRRLAASDVQVLPDRWEQMASEQKTAWAAYRQALRDLPQTVADPANPSWPVAPA